MKIKIFFILNTVVALGLYAQFNSKVNFNQLLYKSAIYGIKHETSKIITDSLPFDIKNHVDTYLERYNNFHSKLNNTKETKDKFIYEATLDKKKGVERGIFSSLSIPDIDSLAADFAGKFPASYEWEGFSECPLREAKYIEDFIKKQPNTPILPYLQILLLHRLKCASETLIYEKNYCQYDIIISEYQLLLNKVYSEDNLLFKLLAEDMDKQEYLYMEIERKGWGIYQVVNAPEMCTPERIISCNMIIDFFKENKILLSHKPIIDEDGILSYTWHEHKIILKDSLRYKCYANPILRAPFAIVINNEIQYLGFNWSPALSISCEYPVIYGEFSLEKNVIQISQNYHNSKLKSDIRENESIKEYLKKIGKLR